MPPRMCVPDDDQTDLARLVAAVRAAARYRQVSPALITAIGRRELAARRGLKAAIKATKGRLHQISGAFLSGVPQYDAWLDQVTAAHAAGPDAFRAACLAIMRHHASTRERLPLLDRFYQQTLAGLTPRTVIDLGCGLHPLALPWMGLPPGVVYRCYDIEADLIDFLNRFFALAGIDGLAAVRDIVAEPPDEPCDLAFALKVLPTLDHLAPDAGAALPRALHARALLASFPTRGLSGRRQGMARVGAERLEALAAAEGWRCRRFVFPGEDVFLVEIGA